MSSPSPQKAGRTVLRHALVLGRGLRFNDLYQSGREFELMGRAMGFAALAMLTVFPLLVLVAAVSAAAHHGLAVWVNYGMGLTGPSSDAVDQLFSAPDRALGTTSAFSLVLLAVFGVTFAGSVQTGLERIWGLPPGPWHRVWRQTVWLAALIAYVYAAASVATVTRHTATETVIRVSVAVGLGLVFFWWGLRFLLRGRVSYRAATPGAVMTMALLVGLRAFSGWVFQPLITGNAVTYGALGTVLIVQSWLVGVGWVIYGGQLFGRWLHDAWVAALAENHSNCQRPDGRQDDCGGWALPASGAGHLASRSPLVSVKMRSLNCGGQPELDARAHASICLGPR